MKNRIFTDRIQLSLVLLGILLLALPSHLRPDNFIVDDGYFYPQIARFIVHGQGSTFNDIMLTNGYHPLWMLVCVVAAGITSASSPLVQILLAVQDVLICACVATLILIARTAKMRGALLGSVPLVFFGVVVGIWRLLETSLALALQMAVLVILVPVLPKLYQSTAPRRNLLAGTLLGLVMLARLDLLFFVCTVLAYQLLSSRTASGFFLRLRAVFVQSCIAGILLVPYLFWNWMHFHHLVTISGAIKSSFPHPQHWAFAPFMYPVLAAILLNSLLFLKPAGVQDSFSTLCLITTVATVLHAVFTLSFGEMAPWYLTTGYLNLALCLLWISNYVIAKIPIAGLFEGGLVAVLFLVFLSLGTLRVVSNFSYTRLRQGQVAFLNSYLEPKRALAIKLKQTLPEASRVFIFDAPGGVAFYSGMSVLPADGLVADFAYEKDIVREGFSSYAARVHLDYVIVPLIRADQTYDRLDLHITRVGVVQTIKVEAPLTQEAAGALSLPDSNLLFRFPQVNPDLEKTFPEVGVWRIQ